MIKYALICQTCDAAFEGWFANSAAFDTQQDDGKLLCPECGAANVAKAIMAPSVSGTKKDTALVDPAKLAAKLARKAREHIAGNYDYVGDKFADEARAMYYGESDERPIWGKTTPEESAALEDEGIPAEPLPEPFTPPLPEDAKKLN